MRIWLKHKTRTDLVYEVLSYDPVRHRGVIRGRLGTYGTPMYPEIDKRAGYELIKEEDSDAKLT